MMDHLYLWVNIGAIIFPLLLSFDRKVSYYRKWKYLFPALLITGIPFVVWDMIFTEQGVWGFNEAYLTGIHIGNLPLEEVLFFFTVPYASVFIYECFVCYTKKEWFSLRTQSILGIVFGAVSIGIGIAFNEQIYTSVTFLSLGAYWFLLVALKRSYLGSFLLAYLIIVIPFFIVNGVLTGSWIPDEIVWYNDAEHFGIRMGTVPIVDLFYGMLLILMNVSILEYLRARDRKQ